MNPRDNYVVKHSPVVAKLEAKADELYQQLGLLQLSRLELLLRANTFIRLADRLDPAINRHYSGIFLSILNSINKAPWEQAQRAWNHFVANRDTRDISSLKSYFDELEQLSDELKKTLEKSSQELLKYMPVLVGVEPHKTDMVFWQQANFLNHAIRYLTPVVAVPSQNARPIIEGMLKNMQKRITQINDKDSKGVDKIINEKLDALNDEIKEMEMKMTGLDRLKQETKGRVDDIDAKIANITMDIMKGIERSILTLDAKLNTYSISDKQSLDLTKARQVKTDLEVERARLLSPSFYRDAEEKFKVEHPVVRRELEQLNEAKEYLGSFQKTLRLANSKINEIDFILSPQERTTELFDTLLVLFKDFFNKIYPAFPEEEKNFPLDSHSKLRPVFQSQFVFNELMNLGFLTDKRQMDRFIDKMFNELLKAYQGKSSIFLSVYDTTDDMKVLSELICVVFYEKIKHEKSYLNILQNLKEFNIGEYLKCICVDKADIPMRVYNYTLLISDTESFLMNNHSPKELLEKIKDNFLEKFPAIFPKNVISAVAGVHSKDSKLSSPPAVSSSAASSAVVMPGSTHSAPPVLPSVADAKAETHLVLAINGESAPPAPTSSGIKIVISPPPADQRWSNLAGDRVGAVIGAELKLKSNISILLDPLTNTLQVVFKKNKESKEENNVQKFPLDDGLMWLKPKIKLINESFSMAEARATLNMPTLSALLMESLSRSAIEIAKKLGGVMLNIRFVKGKFKAQLTMANMENIELGIDVFKQRLEKAQILIHPKMFELLAECEMAYLAIQKSKEKKKSSTAKVAAGLPSRQHFEVAESKRDVAHSRPTGANRPASAFSSNPVAGSSEAKRSGVHTGPSAASTVIRSPVSEPTLPLRRK